MCNNFVRPDWDTLVIIAGDHLMDRLAVVEIMRLLVSKLGDLWDTQKGVETRVVV